MLKKICDNWSITQHNKIEHYLNKGNSVHFRRPDLLDLIIFLGIIGYSICFSFLSEFKFISLQLEYDLAVFSQALWNTIIGHGILYNSLEGISHLGVHFSPILFSLIPLYIFDPQPETLLIIQSILLSIGAIPIYLTARFFLGGRAGCLMGCIYLINPAVHGVNLYDFHELAFLPFLLGMTLWSFLTERRNLFIIFSLLSLCVKEDVSLIIMMIGLIGIIQTRKQVISERWQYLFITGISITIIPIFFLLIKPVILPLESPFQSGFLFQYGDPFSSVVINKDLKITYFLQLFGPLLFTPLASMQILLCGLFPFLEIFISSNPYYFNIEYQYSALIIPILFISSILSLSSLQKSYHVSLQRLCTPLIILIAISSLISFALTSPAIDEIKDIKSTNMMALYHHVQKLNEIIATLPPESTVYTQYNLLPHVSHFNEIYADPSQKADFILLDKANPPVTIDFQRDMENEEELIQMKVIYPEMNFQDYRSGISNDYLFLEREDSIYLFVNRYSPGAFVNAA